LGGLSSTRTICSARSVSESALPGTYGCPSGPSATVEADVESHTPGQIGVLLRIHWTCAGLRFPAAPGRVADERERALQGVRRNEDYRPQDTSACNPTAPPASAVDNIGFKLSRTRTVTRSDVARQDCPRGLRRPGALRGTCCEHAGHPPAPRKPPWVRKKVL
jgi:hypothetical protein